MDVQRWTRKKYKKLSFFNISISCPTYRSQPKKRMTTCPNIQSKQQIGFACTLHDPGPSVLLTLDLTLGTLQQFSSFLSACETPQPGVRHWSNTSTDKRLIFPRAMRRILPRKQILCRHVPRKAIWHTHTRREWIIIWSGRNWVLKQSSLVTDLPGTPVTPRVYTYVISKRSFTSIQTVHTHTDTDGHTYIHINVNVGTYVHTIPCHAIPYHTILYHTYHTYIYIPYISYIPYHAYITLPNIT